MSYGQINYPEKVGNGPYTIAQIGCFVTAFCNLLATFGVNVDPPTLNNFFETHGDYLSDPGDGPGVKDDLGWNSVTAYNSGIVVTGQGGAGWPNTNNAIVKFYYKSARTGQMETHFCLVADHNAKTIVDSWDGVTKAPGEYGTPIGWASYGGASVQPVVTAANPPAAPAPQHPTTPPASGPTSLFLPSAAGTWRVYNVAGPYTSAPVDHSIHKLVPGAFPPGLTYQVLATLAPHVYKIQTQDFGQVAIYAGPDTIAQFPGGGHGDGEEQPTEAVLSKLDPVQQLVTNKEATVYDYQTGAMVNTLPAGTPFTATTKATKDDNVYFVDDTDPGTVGVKTVDLSPAPTPPADPVVPPADEDAGEKVPVKVSKWQDSYTAFMSPQQYVANQTVTVLDVDDDEDPQPNQKLVKGQTIQIAGKFVRDGVGYYRSANSVAQDAWYGIPLTAVTKPSSDEELEQMMNAIKKENLTSVPKDKPAPANSGGFVSRMFGKNKGV